MSELATVDSGWPELLAPVAELARVVADTDFVPGPLRGNPGAITACVLYGHELGIGPMEALQSIDVIEGRPSPSAELVRALVLRDGHSFVIHEATGTRCVTSGLRRGRPESERTRVEWTLDDARTAGLLQRRNWQRYPRQMLVARATTELARQVFPDVVKGLGDIPDTEATVTATATEGALGDIREASPPPRKRVARKRAPKGELPPATGEVGSREPGPDDVPLPAMPEGPPQAPPKAERPPVAPPAQPRTPWPPVPPERPAKGASGPMEGGLRRAYMASFSGADIDPDAQRELRLAVTQLIIGRPIESSTQLSKEEGLKVVGTMAQVETGALAIVADKDGAPKLISLEEPPAEPSADE
jgi:hypothetical protein